MTEGEEVVALIKSYYDQGKIPQDDPQLASKLAAIKAKYTQQQPTQQQTTTQDTGALANVGTDDGQQDTGKKVYLTSNQGNLIPGQRSSRFVYMVDQDTGQQYVYDDNEGASEETGWQSGAPPTGANLKITAINSKDDEDWKLTDVSDQNLTWGGVTDPETLDQYTAQANREPGYESGGGGLFYEYNGRSYYTPDNTGQGIPVGAEYITRDPTQVSYQEQQEDGSFEKKYFDESTYTQPVLTKGFTSYYPQGDPKAEEDTRPTPTTSFTEALTSPFVEGGTGSGAFDLGSYFGLDEGQLTLSNPDSNQFNLEKFFNQTESMGTQNFLRSQSIDVLDDIINDGNFFKALAGKNFELPDGKGMYYDYVFPKMQEGGFQQPSYDADQLENFFDDLRESNRNPDTKDIIYSNTSFSTDPFNISGGDDTDTGPMMRDVYGKRPVYGEFFGGRRGGMWDRFLDSYLTRFGYNPQTFDELVQAVEQPDGSTLYYGADGALINPASLEGINLSDPIREVIGEENVLLGTQTLDPSGAVTSTTYTDIYDPEEDEKYFLDLLPT